MATIREVFELEDKFTATFTQYIKLGTDAAASTRAVRDAATRATAAARVQSAAMNAAASSARAESAAYRLTVSQSKAKEQAYKESAAAVRLETEELRKLKAQQDLTAKSTSGFIGKLKGLVGAYVGLQSVKSFIGLADTMTQTTARLDMMNDGLQSTEELNRMIYESAQRSRGAYQDTADMVAKLGTLAGSAFNNNTADIVAFAEQLNKQIALSGASAETASGAMLQLTQAMASGVLRGDELNSIMEGLPTVAQSIASYMGVSTGQMKELASQGAVTAEVVKNALFEAADETNNKFAQMPMTWSQLFTSFQNTAIMALQPVLSAVNSLANNFDTIAPVLAGVGAGAAAAAIGLKLMAAATWIANGSAKAFFATLMSNPLTYIAVVVGLVVYAIYQWVQSVGGLQIAWLTVVDNVLFAWDNLKIGFMTGVYAVQNWLDNLSLAWQATGIAVQNWMGDMKVGALTILQDMINGAIDLLNQFSGKINTIFGTSFAPLEKVTFAATAAAENEAAKQARAQELAAATQAAQQAAAERANNINDMVSEMAANHLVRQQEIQQKRMEQMAGSGGGNENPYADPYSPGNDVSDINDKLSKIAGSTSSIEKSVDMSQEDLKSLVDVAERRYVNQINLNAPTPVIQITGQNTGNTQADRMNLANTIRDILIEQVAAGSTVNTSAALF